MAKRKMPPRLDPETEWSNDGGTSEEGIELCDRILKKLEDAPGSVWDKAYTFFESVEEKVKSMLDTIKAKNTFTERQKTALENMEGGIDRWLK